MLIAGAMQAILDAFGSLTFFIDKGIYFFAKAIYDVFMFIADARLLDNGIAMNLTRRMYAILSIFMLFVLGYNLLLYIIDPDKMTDKEKGMGAIIKNVVIALVVIILLPTLFNRLYSLQSMVLKSGVIENLFLGGYTEVSSDELGNTSNPSASSGIEKGVNIMIANTYAAFLLPEDENNFTVLQCDDGESENTYTDYCEAWKNVKDTGNIAYFSTFVGNDDYRFYPFISTVVGIVLIFFMLSFCINLAIRAAKMVILQLIAPIPLVLEILPNKKGVRQGWVKELISVYLQVFIYMAMIFLVIFLISMVPNVVHKIIATNFKDIAKSAGTFTMLVALLIISYGLLLFGKEAPGYVLKLMGIESTGILKAAGLRAYRMFGSTVSGAGTGLTSSVRNAYAMTRNFREADNTRGKLKALGKGTIGTVSGLGMGAVIGGYANRTGGLKGIVSRTGESVKTTLSTQKKVSNEVSVRTSGLFEALSSDNVPYGPDGEQGRKEIKNIFTQAFNPYDKHRVRDWVTGGSFEEVDKEMSALLSATGSKTDYGKDDEGYKAIDKKYNEYKRDALLNGTSWDNEFNDWKETQPANAVKTEDAFANYIKNSATASQEMKNIANAYQAKETQRKTVNDNKKEDYRNKIIEYVSNIENNKNINLNRAENAEIKSAVEKLKSNFRDGDIHTRELIDSKTGSDLLSDLNTLDKAVKKKQKDVDAIRLARRNKNNNEKDK